MGRARINIEFPCGYKFNMEVGHSPFDIFYNFNFSDEEFRECPLHGKNCPPDKNKKKK